MWGFAALVLALAGILSGSTAAQNQKIQERTKLNVILRSAPTKPMRPAETRMAKTKTNPDFPICRSPLAAGSVEADTSIIGSGVRAGPALAVVNIHTTGKQRVTVNGVPGTVIARSKEDDLALILTAPAEFEPFRIAPPVVGEEVFAIGNPNRVPNVATEGRIEAYPVVMKMGIEGTSFKRNGEVIYTNVPIAPGSSGGALWDADGNLVGIAVAYFCDADENGRFRTIFIPAERIESLLIKGGQNELPRFQVPKQAHVAEDSVRTAPARGIARASCKRTGARPCPSQPLRRMPPVDQRTCSHEGGCL